jgi:hypothetical protein
MKSAIILFGCLAFLFLSSSAGSAPANQQISAKSLWRPAICQV